jgi:hypothetical protein
VAAPRILNEPVAGKAALVVEPFRDDFAVQHGHAPVPNVDAGLETDIVRQTHESRVLLRHDWLF